MSSENKALEVDSEKAEFETIIKSAVEGSDAILELQKGFLDQQNQIQEMAKSYGVEVKQDVIDTDAELFKRLQSSTAAKKMFNRSCVPGEKVHIDMKGLFFPGALSVKTATPGTGIDVHQNETETVPRDFRYDLNRETIPGIQPLPRNEPTFFDMVRKVATTATFVDWYLQTDRVNGAAGVPEGTLKPSSAQRFAKKHEDSVTFATVEKVTRQLAKDLPALYNFVRNELSANVIEKVDQSMLIGDGTPDEEFLGILNQPGTFHQAWDQNLIRTVRKALLQLQKANRFRNVSGYTMVVNYDCLVDLDLMANDEHTPYYLVRGTGMEQFVREIFGVKIVASNVMPFGKFVMMTDDACTLYVVDDLQFDMTYTDQDDFVKNLLTMREEMRGIFVVDKPYNIVVGGSAPGY